MEYATEYFAGGNVRVEVGPDLVLVVMAHGEYEAIGPALDYAHRFTGGSDSLVAVHAADEITLDDAAVVTVYARQPAYTDRPITLSWVLERGLLLAPALAGLGLSEALAAL